MEIPKKTYSFLPKKLQNEEIPEGSSTFPECGIRVWILPRSCYVVCLRMGTIIMITWLKNNFSTYHPTAAIALNATRHISKIARKKLFSDDIEPMRTAEGRWYEAIIYEMFLEMSLHSDEIRYLARKGADAPRQRNNFRLGQNGFFYSPQGDIVVRGNGQDLAEFDLLLIDSSGQVAFGEVITTPSDLKEFEVEIQYKKRLLGYLFGQKTVPFILASSLDLSNYSVVRRLIRSPENAVIHTITCDQIKTNLKHIRKKIVYQRPEKNPKLILANSIPLRQEFEYLKFHNEERKRIVDLIGAERDVKKTISQTESGLLVKKVLYGALFPSAVRALTDTRNLTIRGTQVPYDILMERFSKVVIASDLPEYEPILYLRPRREREYYKMIQDRSGNFRFERATPSTVGFFLWLESLTPSLGSKITLQLLDAFRPAPEKMDAKKLRQK